VNHPRKRILLVTRNLPPLVGGMERLNWHMAEELAKVAEVRVVGPHGSVALAPAGVVVREAPLKPLWRFLWRARSLARREAKTWRPHIVLAGSGLTAPIARSAARVSGAKSAAYVHGLDIAARHPVYRVLWLPAIRGMDRVIANSHATAELSRGIGVDPARIGIVHPGVQLPADVTAPSEQVALVARSHTQPACEAELPPSERSAAEWTKREAMALSAGKSRRSPVSSFRTLRSGDPESGFGVSTAPIGRAIRQRQNLGTSPVLLSVGRLSARKGLREFVSQALPRIVAEQPRALFLIVGDAPNQALHAETQTPDSIQAAADAAGVGEHVQFLGTITDYAELGALYRAADVHVFPVREIPGDPEGFGMVAVEAAAHGLPTVGFATGGVIDAVFEGQSGFLVRPGDHAAFADAVLETCALRETLRPACIAFAQRFAWPAFGEQLVAELSGSLLSGLRA
jgi:phosphatidylinositol alpha-1,6-mannosyltransferase